VESKESARDPEELLRDFTLKVDVMRPNRKVFFVEASRLREAYEKLVNEYGEENVYLSTLAGVDKPEQNVIELNYFIHIVPRGETIVLKTTIPRSEPRVQSLAGLTHALSGEFETYDLLGVVFEGNKWLKRGFFVPLDIAERGIFPLRKDAKV